MLRRIRVEVDGAEVGRLRPGERIDVPLTAGTHEVTAHLDAQHSEPVTVAIDGEEVVLEVGLPPLSLRRFLTRGLEPIQVIQL